MQHADWRISNGPCTPCDGKRSNLTSRICFHTQDKDQVLCYFWGFFFYVYTSKTEGKNWVYTHLVNIYYSKMYPFPFCLRAPCLLVEASWWSISALALTPTASGAATQVPPPLLSCPTLPHTACRGKCREASLSHYCTAMWSKWTTEGKEKNTLIRDFY